MSHVKRNSGQPKQKWTLEEEQALRLGVKSYGVGKWRLIQKDDACGPVLANRSNVDLKDKWRNLNMEAREQAFALLQSDDDPDFQPYKAQSEGTSATTMWLPHVTCGFKPKFCSDKQHQVEADTLQREVSSRKRKKPRNSIASPSAPQRPSQQHDAPAEVTQDSEHAVTAAAGTEADSLQPGPQPRPPPTPINCVLPDSQGSLDISPDGRGRPIVDDMVVAAVISLHDPVGSGLDNICAWIEDHYPAVDRDKVNVVMNKMVQAGRLWRVPHHTTLVRMGGMIMPEAEAEQAMSDGDADMFARVDEGKLISDKMVAEHALLAAHAVADAEAAVKKASNLLAAANALEELDCGAHDSNQGT